MIICSFSVGIDELKPRQQGDMRAVARVIAKNGRFSSFEASANKRIALTMDRITRAKWFEFSDAGYPWMAARLTDAGRAALAEEP